METTKNNDRYYLYTDKNEDNDDINCYSLEDEIDNVVSNYEIPILGYDKFIDLRRLTDIFTVYNNNVLLNTNNKDLWKPLKNYLECKGDPVYRSAKNILLAYKYIMMDSTERNCVMNFFSTKGYRNKYNDFSWKCGLTVNTLKNFSGYIGTERWKTNILGCLMLCEVCK